MANVTELKVKIGADASSLNRSLQETKKNIDTAMNTEPLKKMSEAAEGVSGTLGKIGGSIAKLTVGIGTLGGLTSAIRGAVDAGDAIYTMSERMHVSAGEAAQLSRILNVTGGDTSTFSSAMMRLDKSFSASGEAGERTRSVLEACGVQLADQNGKLLPLNDQLKNMAAGYKAASDAGYGQEFLMNTLGVRGLALTKTLQEYNEAAAAAGRVEGIGLDPEEMHKISMELKVMDMEMNQVKMAFASALAPTVQELLPGMISGLSQTAVFIRNNKDEIKKLAGDLTALLAIASAFKVARAAAGGAQSIWVQAQAEVQAAATAQNAAQAEITARHEAEIAKRIAAIERESQRQQQAAIKAALRTTESAEEASAIIAEKCAEIEARTAATAEKIAAGMRAGFAAEAEAANLAAAEAAAAMERTKLAAIENGARMTEAHASIADSALVASGAIDTMALSETGAGNAATVAGAKSVGAKAETSGAAIKTAGAVETITAAEVGAGVAAEGAAVKQVGFMATAEAGAKSLTKSLWALAGGWWGVAAAAAYAAYCAYQYKQGKLAEEHRNTVTLGSGEQAEFDNDTGEWSTKTSDHAAADNNITSTYTNPFGTYGTATRKLTESESEEANNKWTENNWEGSDAQKMQELEDKQNEAKQKADEALQKALQGISTGGNESGKAGKSSEPKEKVEQTINVEVPLGDIAYDAALGKIGEDYQLGAADDDEYATDCGKFVRDMYNAAGIDFQNRSVPSMIDEADKRGAWHPAGDGYIPSKGDAAVVLGNDHIVMANGQGGYVGANSSTGVIEKPSIEDDFGAVTGYISASELSGGATQTQTISKSEKSAQDALSKLQKAKADALNLFRSMQSEVDQQTESTYEYGMEQVAQNIQKKQQQIAKLQAQGVDTTALQSELSQYETTLQDKVVKKWKDACEDMSNETRSMLDEANGDYADAAEDQYKSTLDKLEQERKEKLQSVQKDKADIEGLKLVNDWYYAQRQKAQKQLDADMRAAHQKRVSELEQEGNIAAVMAAMNTTGEQQSLDLEGNQKLAAQYVETWERAHRSINGEIASASSDLYSSMSSSLQEFIKGSKSAIDVIQDFGNEVLSMIAKIAAERAAAGLVNGLLGLFGGSGGGSTVTSYNPTGLATSLLGSTAFPHADGGYVDAFAGGGMIRGAGTGRSDSILAYVQGSGKFIKVSDREYIMNARATDAYAPLLESLNTGKFADGGYIAAPTLGRSTMYSGSGAGGTAGSQRGGIVVNVINNNGSDVKVQDTRYDEGLDAYVCEIVLNSAVRNRGGFGTNLKTALGAK